MKCLVFINTLYTEKKGICSYILKEELCSEKDSLCTVKEDLSSVYEGLCTVKESLCILYRKGMVSPW